MSTDLFQTGHVETDTTYQRELEQQLQALTDLPIEELKTSTCGCCCCSEIEPLTENEKVELLFLFVKFPILRYFYERYLDAKEHGHSIQMKSQVFVLRQLLSSGFRSFQSKFEMKPIAAAAAPVPELKLKPKAYPTTILAPASARTLHSQSLVNSTQPTFP